MTTNNSEDALGAADSRGLNTHANWADSPSQGPDSTAPSIGSACHADATGWLGELPVEMRDAKRWLLWKSVPNDDPTKKPRKVPYYVDGTVRMGPLDSPADIAHFATLAEAVAELQTGRYAGLGFALGPDGTGAHWQGIDFDGLSGRPALCDLTRELPGYIESSPSGDGAHAIGLGRPFKALGPNATGIEAYSTGRFFTVTGDHARAAPIVCLASFVETRLAPLHNVAPAAPTTPQSTGGGVHIDDDTVRDLRSALMSLRADDRDLWVRVGLALTELSNIGRGLWMEWSSQSEKFEPRDAARTWESFIPTTIGHQSVFFEAQKHGWINTRSGKSSQAAVWNETDSGFVFVSAGELTATPTPVSYLIEATIETEALCLLFAPPSAGKSFVAISIAAAVATGLAWLGRETKQGAVFYLADEGHAGLRRRLKAWELQTGQSLAAASLFISKTAAALMSEESAQAVMKSIHALCIKHGAPRLIVIDTFARNMGDGDENSNADVGVFINRIDSMRAELGCAVLLVHHSGHATAERARGASALHAAMDTVFRLDGDDAGISMKHIKAKESELSKPLSLALEQVTLTGWFDASGDVMNSAVLVLGAGDAGSAVIPLTPQQKVALDFFRDTAKVHGELTPEGRFAGLHVEIWRREYYLLSSTASANAKKTAFLRVREKLLSIGRLSETGDIFHFTGLTAFLENFEVITAIKTRNSSGTRHTHGT